MTINYRTQPFTDDELLQHADADGFVTGIFAFDLAEAIDNDLDGWLDILCEALCGRINVQQPDFTLLAVGPNGEIIGSVSGDVSMILDEINEERALDEEDRRILRKLVNEDGSPGDEGW